MTTDQAQFEAFAQLHYRKLLQLCWALIGDFQLAQDLSQTTLERMWKRWPKVSERGDPWPYAQRVAINLATNWKSRKWRKENASLDDAHPDALMSTALDEASDTRVIMVGWLAGLPPRQRACVVLRFLCDLSVDETAATLKCTCRNG